jgi:hypothetical protein
VALDGDGPAVIVVGNVAALELTAAENADAAEAALLDRRKVP